MYISLGLEVTQGQRSAGNLVVILLFAGADLAGGGGGLTHQIDAVRCRILSVNDIVGCFMQSVSLSCFNDKIFVHFQYLMFVDLFILG